MVSRLAGKQVERLKGREEERFLVNNKVSSYKDLIVWQKSFQLSLLVYEITKGFPKDEVYGLVSQMRRCAVSVPSNIAEGFSRHRKLEYIQFLHIAFGSIAELETQTLISKELKYLSIDDSEKIGALIKEITQMLNSLIVKIKNW